MESSASCILKAIQRSSLWDPLTYTHATRASSTVLPRQGAGPVLLSAVVGEAQGQPSRVEGAAGSVPAARLLAAS